MAAAGQGGRITDQRGAFHWVKEAPFGRILLIAMVVGFAGYALWRFIQAIRDTEREGSSVRGVATRISYFFAGIVYAALAYSVAWMAIGAEGGVGGEAEKKSWTAWLLVQPFGPWLVALIGASIIAAGLYQYYKAYAAKFSEKLKRSEMSRDEMKWVIWIGRFGLAARGVVFNIIGGFLISAAIQSDPSETRGLRGALLVLANQPYGPWLLGATSIGLIVYGLFSIALARYRRMVIR
jgi:hypothetical protein